MCIFCPRLFPVLLLPFAITVISVPSLAQEPGKFEVSGGAAFVGNTDIVDGYGPGWVVGGGWYAKRWLAVGIELDRSTHAQELGLLAVDASVVGALAGARVSMLVGPIRPVAQVLAGQAQVSIKAQSDFPIVDTADFYARHKAMQVGGGADVSVDEHFSVRITLDYRRIFGANPFWQRRFTTAAVYRFGGR